MKYLIYGIGDGVGGVIGGINGGIGGGVCDDGNGGGMY